MTLTSSDGTTRDINLNEDVLSEDETTSYPNRVPTFHGYSFTGKATAEYVYVGRGQKKDFERLVALGVELEGKIALARYGGPFRGLKVKNAQEHGMIGCVIFTDTGDDGNVTEAKGVAAYPHGKARNPSTVQRGSVQFLSTQPGDPTTPGYPSKKDSPRQSPSDRIPSIPSLPISWVEGQKLIQALDGHGPTGKEVNRTNWVGAFNASYSTGPAPGSQLTINNVMQDNTTWIWDAMGIINGSDPEKADEVIILGNHRDAWIIGGAADPNSGSAVMVELSKAFGALVKTGWKPKRTIVLCSWDGEEYGLVGSTEWVEEYLPWLNSSAVTYLNVDVAVSGPDPSIDATPDLHEVAIETMKKVAYPYRGHNNLTFYDVWESVKKGEIGVLGSGSDYTGFVHSGVSSLDMTSGPGPTDAVYHYHSDYDSYHWMTTFGDPYFATHKVMGQYLALLTYELSTSEILPLDPTNYGAQMDKYLIELNSTIASSNFSGQIDTSPIQAAIGVFNASSAAFANQVNSKPSAATIANLNRRLREYQRQFTWTPGSGLPNRPFYKHTIFAPGLDTGYAPVTYPGVTEAILEYSNVTMANEYVAVIAKSIENAAAVLNM